MLVPVAEPMQVFTLTERSSEGDGGEPVPATGVTEVDVRPNVMPIDGRTEARG